MTSLAAGLDEHSCDVECISCPSRMRLETFSSFADNSGNFGLQFNSLDSTNLTYSRIAGILKIQAKSFTVSKAGREEG